MAIASPLRPQERNELLDAIRGFALCGILILNMPGFSGPYQWIFDFRLNSETGLANRIMWYLQNFILEGSFRALFSMLFGAGVILLIGRLEGTLAGLRPADVYYRRLIWLLIFGLINAWVILWVGDILYCYAICGLFLFPFRNASPRLLILLTVFFMAVLGFKSWLSTQDAIQLREKGMVAMALESKKDSLTTTQKADLAKWKERLESQKIENLRKQAREDSIEVNQSYSKVWVHYRQLNHDIQSVYLYDEFFFDALIFMLLGMALFKLGILTGSGPWWMYAAFVVVGYLGVCIWGYAYGRWWQRADFDLYRFLELNPLEISLYQVRRLFASFAHLGVLILLWKSGAMKWVITAFARVGQMAFTNYLMQSVICTFIFFGYGLGLYGKIERYEQAYFIVGVWFFQILFSILWLTYFRFGPLEWAWRSLTYWKIQPLRKNSVLPPDSLP